MKKVIKWIFIIAIVAVLAIDIYGIWKYKINGTEYASTEPEEPVPEEEIVVPEEPPIEYAELSNEDFWQNQKLFITDIEIAPGQNLYEIKGLIYEEYTIDVEEYTNLKNSGGTIELFGKMYTMDKIQSYNLMLKSAEDDSDAESFYIKYDYTNKKYVLKDATTDYTVYKASEKYVATTVNASLPFIVQKNNKTEKLTVEEVAESHTNIPVPEEQVKINYSTLEFSRNGEITKITELNN